MDAYIATDAPVRLISWIVDQLDLTSVMESYSGDGCSCYSPRMLLKVLFYGYLNNLYSCRKIARAMEENIHYMWLSGKQFPKYNTINNFRSLHLKDTINDLFTQVVLLLVDMGYLTLKEQYIDGTKLESRANKYTFVWRKSVEKHKSKLEDKIRCILQEIETGIASDNTPDDEPPTPIKSDELRERIAGINRENRNRKAQKQLDEITNKYIPKLEEYEQKLAICGKRNSYSKTDTDATFMRMKEDATTLTLIPFMELHESRYSQNPSAVVADSGYGSEENYAFLDEKQISAYVKYNWFHKEQKRKYRNNAFLADNLYYNEKDDYFVCPMGQHRHFAGKGSSQSENGYRSQLHIYQAQRCTGCPLRGSCHKSKGNRRIEVNHVLT
jgi:transposase